MSTIVFSIQSSISFTILSVKQKTSAIPKVVRCLTWQKPRSPLRPNTPTGSRHSSKKQEALETLEDQVSSLTEEIRSNAYKNFLEAYRDALTPVWNMAHFTNIETILATIANPQMTELTMMDQQLKPALVSSSIVKEKRKVPDLKTISTTLKDKFLSQSLPDSKVCEKIGKVFAKLSEANKAYAEAAKGLADLSTLVTPEQYTMLLTTATTPTIQIVVPGQLISPLATPTPPQPLATTALG